MKEKIKNQNGFIQIPILITIIMGVLVVSGIGYFSVKQYQDYKDPKSVLIGDFFKDPTLENFKSICSLAKNIEGNTTKQVLDSNREKMITIKQSLYYDNGMMDCQILDQEKGEYFLPLNDNSLIAFQDNDTDEIRKAKIIFNDKIKNLIATSKIRFVIFRVPGDDFSSIEYFQKSSNPIDFRLRGLSGYFE